jgi:predicted AlkP superfamily phosphohydrolase/phosphomutase
MRSKLPQLVKISLAFCLILGSCASPRTAQPSLTLSPSISPTISPETATPTRQTIPLTPGWVTADPTAQPVSSSRPSLLLISWDGAGADLVNELMQEGCMPHFSALVRQGLQAEYAQTLDPSLTFAVHNSLSTGSLPRRTGIVSNAYHNMNDSFYWYRTGDEAPLEAAEPVWVTASRAGLTSATVLFPGSSTSFPNQAADYTVDFGVRDAYSRQAELSLAPAAGWDKLPSSFNPVLEAEYRIPEVALLRMLVIDTTDDGTQNYDTVFLISNGTPRNFDDKSLRLHSGEWGSLELLPNLHAGAEFLIQNITPEQLKFYHTGVYHNRAWPRRLLEEINQQFGFFPGGADAYAMDKGWINETDYLHLLQRTSEWAAGVTAWIYSSYHPDLIFAWQENFDSAGHQFFLRDPRQPGYSPERARQYEAFYRQAAEISDQALEKMLREVNLKTSYVLLTADHGMAPVHTTVYINTVLQRAGLLVLDSKNYVVVERSRAFAVASGGAANVYINLKGREETGTVMPEEYSAVQQQVIQLLTGLVDPETGSPVFQRVLAREDLVSLGLDHSNSGDIFVQADLGYNLDGWRGEKKVFSPGTVFGQHGYTSSRKEMQAPFIAAGGSLPGGGQMIPPVRLIDIAPTIANLLGIEPASRVDGKPIQALIYPYP